jgi:hypothetical protein
VNLGPAELGLQGGEGALDDLRLGHHLTTPRRTEGGGGLARARPVQTLAVWVVSKLSAHGFSARRAVAIAWTSGAKHNSEVQAKVAGCPSLAVG